MMHCQLQLYNYILHSIQLLQHMYSISRHLLAFIPKKACNNISGCLMIISTKQDNHSSSVDGNRSIDRSIRVLSQYQFLCLSRCAISYYFLISVVCSFLICMRFQNCQIRKVRRTATECKRNHNFQGRNKGAMFKTPVLCLGQLVCTVSGTMFLHKHSHRGS